MINKKVSIYILLMFFIHMIYCTTSPIESNGLTGVSDIPNGTISGMVTDKNSLSIANAKVSLREIALTSKGDIIIDEKKSVADVSGNYTFDSVKNGTYIIYSQDSISGMSTVISNLQINEKTIVQNLTLKENITIKGRIVADVSYTKPITVFIPGLNKQVQIDNNGYYQLDSIPYGRYDLGFIYNDTLNFLTIKTTGNSDTVFIRDVDLNNCTRRSYSFFGGKYDSVFSIDPLFYTQNPDWYSGKDIYAASYYKIINDTLREVDENGSPALLLDNFNDNDDNTELCTVYPDNAWYGWDDRLSGGTTTMDPPLTESSRFEDYIVPYEGMGNVAHVQCTYGNTIQSPYAGFGCFNRVNPDAYLNFKNLTAISFDIKGKGSIRISFRSKKVDDYQDGIDWGNLQKTITLPAEWQKITIPVDELTPPDFSQQQKDGLTWNDVKDSIISIQFESTVTATAGESIDVWIDNIVLHGIRESDLK